MYSCILFIDCVFPFCDTVFHLCSGGLETEQEYPYEAVDEKCKFKKSEAVVYVNGSVSISKDETSELCLHNFCQFATVYTCTFAH